jgi:hypothetical protein
MAGYKVSYKVLRKQGDDMKAVAKRMTEYAEKVNQVNGKLGDDEMLAQVRNNLQKLNGQLRELTSLISGAGELILKIVESYGGTEKRQVKKVSGAKAHNRDFYKNPVSVGSGGGGGGWGNAPSAGAATGGSYTQVNIQDNSVVNIGVNAEPSSGFAGDGGGLSTISQEAAAPASAGGSSLASSLGGAAGAGLAGAAVLGALKESQKDADKRRADDALNLGGADSGEELEETLRQLKKLQGESGPNP